MESKSPCPGKDWVGVVDVEESTRVPSDSSDVVGSGDVWVDLNSISDSESESESCGKVLLCVSDCLGFWSARLANRVWVIFHIKHIHHHNIRGIAAKSPLNTQVLRSWSTTQLIHLYSHHFNYYTHSHIDSH